MHRAQTSCACSVQGGHDLDEVYDDEAAVDAQADEHRPPVSVEVMIQVMIMIMIFLMRMHRPPVPVQGANEPEVESVIVGQLATNCSSLF